jgi:hypothetical protein
MLYLPLSQELNGLVKVRIVHPSYSQILSALCMQAQEPYMAQRNKLQDGLDFSLLKVSFLSISSEKRRPLFLFFLA